MYKNFFASLILTMTLALSVVFVPHAFAQSVNGVDDGGLNQSQQGAGNTPTTQTTQQNNGVNWMWLLLPLLAIPVVMLLNRNNTDDDRTFYQDRGVAGMKGGEARGVHDDDEE
jgi:hypothetical protein